MTIFVTSNVKLWKYTKTRNKK